MPVPVWLVRATDPGLGVFRDTGVVAVNCLIEEDVTALSPAEMRALLPAGRNGKYAVELARLLALPTGALVVARDSRREELLVGVVAGPYRHRPGLVAGHPHTRDVTWTGRVRRAELTGTGTRLPGLVVLAVGPLQVTDEGAALLGRAPTRGSRTPLEAPRGRPTRSVASATPPRRRTAPVTTDPGMRGRDLLAIVPRRLGRPGAWLDPQRVRADRQCPRGMCFDHTEHRYQLEVTPPDAQPDGPNVLVVGVNPTCPDVDSPGNQTYRQVRRLGRGVQAASCGMVNLATLRTGEASDLLDHPASEIVGPRQGEALGWALSQADLVVLAHGRLEGRLADALASGYALLREHLAVEQVRGLIIAQVGDFPSHPWPWGTRIPGPDDALVSQLVQVGV